MTAQYNLGKLLLKLYRRRPPSVAGDRGKGSKKGGSEATSRTEGLREAKDLLRQVLRAKDHAGANIHLARVLAEEGGWSRYSRGLAPGAWPGGWVPVPR